MIEISQDKLDKLKIAILDCVGDTRTVGGLKVSFPLDSFNPDKVEFAALQSIMTLLTTWVRPNGVKFLSGFGTPHETSY